MILIFRGAKTFVAGRKKSNFALLGVPLQGSSNTELLEIHSAFLRSCSNIPRKLIFHSGASDT